MQIADRVFIVTGASSGIGRETARLLCQRGARVTLVARRAERLDELAEQLGPSATSVPADVTTAEAPERIVEQTLGAHGRIDGLINNAGRGMVGQVVDLDLDLLDESLELNLIAPLRVIQRVVPHLIEAGEGVIVNVSSPVTHMGLPGIAGYSMAKAGLNMLGITLRRELAGTGVQVMTVFPGVADTEYYDNLMRSGVERDEDPRPPARPPEVVAAAIVAGILANRREVWALSGRERRGLALMRALGRVAPGVLDRGLGRPR